MVSLINSEQMAKYSIDFSDSLEKQVIGRRLNGSVLSMLCSRENEMRISYEEPISVRITRSFRLNLSALVRTIFSDFIDYVLVFEIL